MDKVQDQRPVYMGTFSKYTKAFESRVALMENDVEHHKKMIRIQARHLETMEKGIKIKLTTIGIIAVAILVLQFFI